MDDQSVQCDKIQMIVRYGWNDDGGKFESVSVLNGRTKAR